MTKPKPVPPLPDDVAFALALARGERPKMLPSLNWQARPMCRVCGWLGEWTAPDMAVSLARAHPHEGRSIETRQTDE